MSPEHRAAITAVADSGLFTLEEIRQIELALMTRAHMLKSRPPSNEATLIVFASAMLKVVDVATVLEKRAAT
jgi:hypothetical protein